MIDHSGESISEGMRLFEIENEVARENPWLLEYHDDLEGLEDIELPELEE